MSVHMAMRCDMLANAHAHNNIRCLLTTILSLKSSSSHFNKYVSAIEIEFSRNIYLLFNVYLLKMNNKEKDNSYKKILYIQIAPQ